MPRTRKALPSIVAALDAPERSLVLDELLAVHPELVKEGDEIARAFPYHASPARTLSKWCRPGSARARAR